ncbi:hypothetical protein OAP42_00045 [Candidatus Marinimicrobia bacterium]|jgi:hypothetical protein|nr:hypothetical protein [Candidatus Neomarinimicrobiota bacterium]MDC0630465.1 hypothetical protein [Candidatus Neomarinimicrobiota bacterium]
MKLSFKTPIKSIRDKCLDCTAGSRKEIRLCPVIECALYPYRFGKRPTQAIVDTINDYYDKNSEPARGLSDKKGI